MTASEISPVVPIPAAAWLFASALGTLGFAASKEATQSDALLVVIGRHWTDTKDKTGRRRLDDRGDFVWREVESGLKRSRRTIPVLVDGAAMPSDDQLPDTLKPLSAQNALELSDSRLNYDLARLTEVLVGTSSSDVRAVF